MAKKTLIYSFLLISLLAAFGIYHIFSIRFGIGDVYPHYSSLRTDPLGAKIFFESLADFTNYTVKRDYDPSPKWEGGRDTTLFILGLHASTLKKSDKDTHQILSWILSSGTRTVISLHSKGSAFTTDSKKDEKTKKDKQEKNISKKDRQDKSKNKDKKTDYSLLKLWGVKISPVKKNDVSSLADLAQTVENINLPPSIKCRPAFYFTDLDDRWTILYSQRERPVIIFKNFGGGTIILCADSYIFSNEAMMSDRYPRLLSWLVGPGKQIYFDESHFGIQKTTGMIDLAYKYRLQGVLAVFLLLAVLYIWKNATPFVPPHNKEYDKMRGIKTERDYIDGLISLLQRYIPAGDLIRSCIKEWGKASTHGKRYTGPATHSARDLEKLADTHKNPSQMYNSISKKLTERKPL